MKLTEFVPLASVSKIPAKLASVAVAAGEPIEISNDIEPFDFNQFLTGGRDGVYFIQAIGDSMETDIFHGDLLIVDRNLQAKDGDRIIASVNGSFTIKFFSASPHNGLRLVAANGKYNPKKITRRDDFQIFGVVTHVVRSFRKV